MLGGAPFNVAWHLEALGSDPILLTAVGDDRPGGEVLSRMEEWGLDSAGVQVLSDYPTGHVDVSLGDSGPGFEIPLDQAWDHLTADAGRAPLRDQAVGLVYHGTLALRAYENGRVLDSVLRAAEAPVFVDLNLRDPWWDEETVARAVSRATWVKLNDDELARISGGPVGTDAQVEATARSFAEEHGVENLIVTRGALGALWIPGEGPAIASSTPDVEVADTVGAGDALSAVLCLGILERWPLQLTLDRATAFAADLCRSTGATSGDLALYDRHVREWARAGDGFRVGPGGSPGLYILSLSIHGLVRGDDVEFGKDPDTGGQIGYVVAQARALVAHPAVERVDVVTRLIRDSGVDDAYSRETESLAAGATIVRIPFGPRRYLRKERLWPYLDSLLDRLLRRIRGEGRIPDVILGHYADAGYVGAQLSKLLGVPFVFTGHSLGRIKRERLLASGRNEEKIEKRYNLQRRIEAEEQALETASMVTASTRQEVEEQYQGYDHYEPQRMEVIPPGVDLSRFSPPPLGWRNPPIRKALRRFLRKPNRPMILALARPDHRKNFQGLLQAYAETPELPATANLVLVAGTRDDIGELSGESRRVLTEILLLIDRYDLYGRVAYPKQHRADDVPDLYRLAARTRGVFVNPALTEPFGLTLLEAAASGLPLVATDDGGPRDIISACGNGDLVDPLEPRDMGQTLLSLIRDRGRWGRYAKSGVRNVHRHYSWESHTRRLVSEVEQVLAGARPALSPLPQTRLRTMDRLILTDVDGTLLGDDEALEALMARLGSEGPEVGFGLATGRSLHLTLEMLRERELPTPDVLVTASGAELHYGRSLTRDRSWERHIRYRWDPDGVREALNELGSFTESPEPGDPDTRLRFRLDANQAVTAREVHRHLRQRGLRVSAFLDHGRVLDVLPVRASPGLAIRFFCFKWNISPRRLLVAGDSGNDADMLSGDSRAVVVANHTPDLEVLRDLSRVHFSDRPHAWGILDGIDHFGFLDSSPSPSKAKERDA